MKENIKTRKTISVRKAVALAAAVGIAACVLTLVCSQQLLSVFVKNGTEKLHIYQKVSAIYDDIDRHYLFDVDEETLLDYLCAGMVNGLEDPYSTYYTADAYQMKQESDAGQLVGIGVSVSYTEDSPYLMIEEIYPDAPAQQAGLQKGDIITAVDGEALSEIPASNSIGLLRGEEGTQVAVSVLRDEKTMEFTVTRADVQIPCVSGKMIGNTGYVRILDFTGTTYEQFKTVLTNLQEQGAQALVFDLRGNTGGRMTAVLDMLDYLLPEGVIATTTNKEGKTKVYRESDASEVDLPMVTLTNGDTASASELFVQALKDYDKAPSVGTKTYGKGILQTPYTLGDGSAVKLTTEYFNPPKSQNFHGKGIEPDYEVVLTEEQERTLELGNPQTDVQLQKALEVVEEKS